MQTYLESLFIKSIVYVPELADGTRMAFEIVKCEEVAK